ncbi:tubulin-specific chaperone cofactor E-like protein isoform X2 [Strongylocentrotus purpuratus]|uniref:Tubulin-specific chaperone cofactor E-like protein n=1 Tax=Strongylocentrotus purpuratus TaxID=7668 RepID=A0A7M7LT39_STRPU|nr:tubulin-specific chaperone cofactor E-like protein isoform X2 [Strongylocentrotus purpuratus]|eukprot:XP_011669984.1 PREDICTED: tubulin-specific chaperone cofactor E-like protein isoform X1 [Strongylocentrotus purpuratus]
MAEKKEEDNSLTDAILTKYGNMESGLHDMGKVQVYFSAPAKKIQSSKDDTMDLKLPRILVLNRYKIRNAGNEERLAELCKSVTELDLAENALDNWKEILKIAGQLPRLEFFNLSSNPLHLATPLATPLATTSSLVNMENIQRLVLNNTKLHWESIHSLLTVMQRLKELHLSLNEFSSVSSGDCTHDNLKLLQFNNNQVKEWEDVKKLGAMFPGLETLILMANPISRLGASPGEAFPNLKVVCLSETLVESWDELDKLNEFPSLKEALVKGIPLLCVTGKGDKAEKQIRQLAVARLGKLESLNRSVITEPEREQAERLFIRKFRHSDVRPARYDELIAKHGHIQELAKVDLTPRTTFNCKITYDDSSYDIIVNVKDNVRQLNKQIRAIVGLPTNKFRTYFSSTDPTHLNNNEWLRYPNRFLHNYKIGDGDIFDIGPA